MAFDLIIIAHAVAWARHRIGLWGAAVCAVVLAGALAARRQRGQPSPAVARCERAYAEGRWDEAYQLCTLAGANGRDPQRAARAVEALARTPYWRDALAPAERLFGSAAGGTARRAAALVHMLAGHDRLAEPLLREALALHQARHEPAEVAHDVHQWMGVLVEQRRFEEALKLADIGIAAAVAAHDSRSHAFLELAVAQSFADLGHAAAARDAFVRAGELQADWPRDRAWTALKHGIFVQDLGELDASITFFKSALELAERYHNDDVRVAALLNLAETERQRGHLDDAAAFLQAAGNDKDVTEATSYQLVAALLVAARGDLKTAEARLGRIAADASDQDYAWSIAYERGRLDERLRAPVVAEARYREAIAIIEALRSQAGAPELRPWVLARRRAPYEALFVLLASGRARRSDALAVAAGLHARSLLDARQAAAPPATGAAALAALGDREALFFFHAQERWWRFHLARGGIVALAPLSAGVDAWAKRWRERLDDVVLAAELGAALIPADMARAADHPLYIIADGALAQLPFAALRTPAGPLVARRPLVRLPGPSTLLCRSRPAPAGSAPVFVGDAGGDLPGARAEVTRAAARFHVTALVGALATNARVLAAWDTPLLHISVHANMSPTGGALELADGSLSSAAIVSRRPAPAMAVLAGCATAASADAEAWSGLPSAFLAAGARTVVATLRSVGDADAAALIDRFYAHDGARQPAVALAAAQRELVDRPLGAWAYFIVYGAASPDDCTRL